MYDFLFDQEFVTEMYHKELEEDARNEGINQGREEATELAIEKLVNTCKAFGDSKEQTLKKLMHAYELTEETALSKINQYWD